MSEEKKETTEKKEAEPRYVVEFGGNCPGYTARWSKNFYEVAASPILVIVRPGIKAVAVSNALASAQRLFATDNADKVVERVCSCCGKNTSFTAAEDIPF